MIAVFPYQCKELWAAIFYNVIFEKFCSAALLLRPKHAIWTPEFAPQSQYTERHAIVGF